MSELPDVITINNILKLLPHRYPFLLVDRVVEIVEGERLVAYKNVTINEPFFQGHFPEFPVMPGVLILEALAQAGGIYVMQTHVGDISNKLFYFTGLNKVKFRKPVVPGDRLDLVVADVKNKLSMWKMSAKALVDGQIAAEGELSAVLTDKES